MKTYECKFIAELPDNYDPAGLELMARQGLMAMIPQVGGHIIEDVSITEFKPPKPKGKKK